MSNDRIAFQLKLRPVKVRKAFAPTTKVVEDKTVYNRKKAKKETASEWKKPEALFERLREIEANE